MEYINLATAEDVESYLGCDYITDDEKIKIINALEKKETLYIMVDNKNQNRPFVKPQSEIIIAFNKENKKANRNILLYILIIIMFSVVCIMNTIHPEYDHDGGYTTHTYMSVIMSGLLVVWYSILLMYTIYMKSFLNRTLMYVKDNNELPINNEKVEKI
jgi:hypothetical protein